MKLKLINNTLFVTSFKNEAMIYEQLNTLSPQKIIQSYINEKRILINGDPLVKNFATKPNDKVVIELKEESIDYALDPQEASIVYEDDVLLIVNKPKNIIIYDIDKNASHTLASHVATYYANTNQSHGIHYIHRLDKDTTGCVVFVKYAFFQPGIDQQLRNRQLKRTYIALAKGIIDKDLTIDKPIGRDRHDKKLRRIDNNGKPAITHVKVLGYIDGNTLVQCSLETGRTHQIRVHLQSINHPLVGDPWYGSGETIGLCLHSYQVKLIHPLTGQQLVVTCSDIPFIDKNKRQQFDL